MSAQSLSELRAGDELREGKEEGDRGLAPSLSPNAYNTQSRY